MFTISDIPTALTKPSGANSPFELIEDVPAESSINRSWHRKLASQAVRVAWEAWANRDQPRARRLARIAVRIDPGCTDGWLCLAEVSTGKARKAYLERVLVFDPDNPTARRILLIDRPTTLQEATARDGNQWMRPSLGWLTPRTLICKVESLASADSILISATLITAIFLAFALRVLQLDAIGLNSDEAVYAGQAAAIVGDADLSKFFSLFRAHPLLVQFIMAIPFLTIGVSDLLARLTIAVPFGVGSVLLVYFLASRLYDRWHGVLAAALVALLPYHVLVSRQVLLDTPMTFFLTISILLFATARATKGRAYFLLAAVAAGIAVLSKSPAVLIWVVILGLMLMPGRSWRPDLKTLVLAGVFFLIIIAPYPLSRLLLAPDNAYDMVSWQFNRPPNHSPDYFLRVLLQFGGWTFVALIMLGLGRAILRRDESDKLIVMWVLVFLGFHQIWPTKLFSYLMVVIPPLVILAVIGFQEVLAWVAKLQDHIAPRRVPMPLIGAVLLLLFLLPLARTSLRLASEGPEAPVGSDFDIEVQSFAGGREFGKWALESTPDNSRFLTIGPSLGNILRFYGNRDSVALSVSPDPLRRNPAYVPVENPDLALRQMAVQYIVWDAYSADRSAFYNSRINKYVDKFGGIPVFSAFVDHEGELVTTLGGVPQGVEARIVVYDIPGGNPQNLMEVPSLP